MPDPMDELSNFEPGVTASPIPAAEVRRRGDRLRRRRTALSVGGAVAAVLLIAVPIAVVAGGDGDGGTPQPVAPTLSEDALLTADELPVRDRLTPWQEVQTEGQVLACAPQLPAALDAPADLRRDFAADVADGPAGETPVSVIRTQVLEFDDAPAAQAAYDQAQGWLRDCPGGDNLARKDVSQRTFEIDAGQGEWRLHEFYATDICTECDAIRFDRMGVAQFGDRMILVSLAEVGGPLEPEGLDASMEELYAAAVDKAGGVITGESASGSDSGEPAGVPIDWDLADLTGDGGRISGPGPDAPGAAEVSPCDRVVWPKAGVDRLAVNTTGPEFAEARELVEFASADEAVAAMGEVRSAVAACPTEINELDPTNSPEQAWDVLESDTGYEDSVTLSLTYTDGLPGGQIWQFTRVGKAIIAVSTSGEYAGGRSAALAAVRLTEITRHIAPEMCRYTVDGC